MKIRQRSGTISLFSLEVAVTLCSGWTAKALFRAARESTRCASTVEFLHPLQVERWFLAWIAVSAFGLEALGLSFLGVSSLGGISSALRKSGLSLSAFFWIVFGVDYLLWSPSGFGSGAILLTAALVLLIIRGRAPVL